MGLPQPKWARKIVGLCRVAVLAEWPLWIVRLSRILRKPLEMLRPSQVRRMLRRLFTAGMAWLMIPLVVWGGIPAVSCACVNCQCGTTCKLSGGAASSGTQVSQTKTACCCCGCGHCSCKTGCCCCCGGGCKATDKESTSVCLLGKGVGAKPADSCRLSVSAQVAVQPAVVKAVDQHPLTLDLALPTISYGSNCALRSTGQFNTGPPLDLVVKLRRLVI